MLRRVLVVLVAILALVSPTVFAQTPTPPETPAAFLPPSPEELRTILADFERYADRAMADWQVPGMAIAVVQGDEVVYTHTAGVRTLGQPEPITADTVFQIGSLTKAFTSAQIGTLVDEGKVGWDDRVVDHVPDFQMYDPWVTREFRVADLMAQHSGMPQHAGDSLAVLGFDRDTVRRSTRLFVPAGSFRSDYAYQNALWLTASKLIENVTGKTWEDTLQERLFTPLGMADSSADLKSFQTADDAASLHMMDGDRLVSKPRDWSFVDWTYTLGPAGSINSTLNDMTHWLRLNLNEGQWEGRQVVSAASLLRTHSPQTILYPSGAPDLPIFGHTLVYYGLGWVYEERSPVPYVWHNGGTSGFHTMLATAPGAQIGIVILANSAAELPDALGRRFLDAYFGHADTDWAALQLQATKDTMQRLAAAMPKPFAASSPPLPLTAYAGDYENTFYGQIAIAEDSSGLKVTIGPRGHVLRLAPFGRDAFAVTIEDLPMPPSLATFTVDAAGRASSVTFDAMQSDSSGTFKRVG